MTSLDSSSQGALSSLGWDEQFSSAFSDLDALADSCPGELVPARVTRVDRGACGALSPHDFARFAREPAGAPTIAGNGPVRATFSGALLAAGAADPVSTPCVGDWIAVRLWPDGRITAEAVLPRRTAFVRGSVTPGSSYGQVLAANVDVAVVVEGLHPEPDLGRIERFLALAWESGASPLVVLTKADLVPDPDGMRAEVAAAAPGVEVFAVSATTGVGLAEISPYAAPGVTLAFLGPSGAGKSTLTNALAGATLMATRELRADGKGRHTTVHRELVMLPGGGLVIDTPGLRSVGLTDVAESLELVFSEVEELAELCKFGDCAHATEPGCAVLAAVESGELPERRLESYRKLLKEARWMAMRHDARLRQQELARWKSLSKSMRASGRIRP